MAEIHDTELFQIIDDEKKRQSLNTELIASENFVSKEVMEAQGSILTNKYAEGYPGKRYYGGCVNVDRAEELARERLKKLFDVKYVNVQPHSGSTANMGAYRALLKPGDRIFGMSIDAGGHLTHGYRLSFSGQDYVSKNYGLDPETEELDYDEIEREALEFKPNIIVCGASAYSRPIDFKRFREIADNCGAYLMADIAHIAGLCATGYHMSPIPYCDIVTSTTHKTLRGPRGGVIMTNNPDIYKQINKNVFPGIQGGPLEHVIAAKAVAFYEDLQPSYREYIGHVCENAKAMAEEFKNMGYKVISGGTDNHLFMLDVWSSRGMTGLECQELLERVDITLNKNSIPGDTQKPFVTSGVRIGTPAMTTRGYTAEDFVFIAHMIDETIKNKDDDRMLESIRKKVVELNLKHPLPSDMG